MIKDKNLYKKLGFELPEYNKFHNKTKFKILGRNINSRFWPVEWKTVYYKAYARLEEIKLPKPRLSNVSFKSVLFKRKSERIFTKKPLSLKDLSSFLYYGAGLSPNKNFFSERRFYPSPGGRFPLEIYVIPLNSELPKGIYHYYVKNHSLEKLADFKKGDLKKFTSQVWSQKAACLIVITAVFTRNTTKYGNRGYRHVLVEAGHMAQNFYLLSGALGIGCCGIGGYTDDFVNGLLDVDGTEESVIYLLALGNI